MVKSADDAIEAIWWLCCVVTFAIGYFGDISGVLALGTGGCVGGCLIAAIEKLVAWASALLFSPSRRLPHSRCSLAIAARFSP